MIEVTTHKLDCEFMVSGNLVFIGGGFCEEDFFLTAEGAEGAEKEKR